MQIDARQVGDVLVVSPLEPSLDAYGATSFREQMTAFVQQGNRRIVLDLGRVDFLDSTGLGAIVSSLKRFEGNGVLVLCSAGEMVADVFRLTRMDRVFPIASSVEQALLIAQQHQLKAA